MAVTRLGAGAGGNSTGAAVTFNGPNIVATGADTVVVVGVVLSVSTNSTATTCAVTIGGLAMTQLSLVLAGTSTNRSAVGLYYRFNPPSGTSSIVVTPGGASTKARVAAQAVAFSGVGSVGAAQSAAATTQAVTSATGNYAVRVLSNGAALSAPNQTSEYLNGASVGGVGDYISMQSAAGAASVSFTASGTATTPQSVGASLVATNAAVATLVDPFTVKDTGLWLWSGGAGVTGGECQQPCTNAFNFVVSNAVYNLTGSSVYTQLVQSANAGNGTTLTFFFVSQSNANTTNSYQVLVSGNPLTITWRETVGGVNSDTTIAYNPAVHKFFRIREASGNIFWDYSTDGSSWTNARTKAVGITITALYVGLETGFTGTEPSPGTAIWDNVNTTSPPPPPGKGIAVAQAHSDYADMADTAHAALPAAMDTGDVALSYYESGSPGELFVSSGRLTFAGGGGGTAAGYASTDAPSVIRGMRIKFKLTARTTHLGAIGVVLTNEHFDGLPFLSGSTGRLGTHFTMTRDSWVVQTWSQAAGFVDINTGALLPALIEDGTEYEVRITRDGTTCYIWLPNGIKAEATDANIGAWSDKYGFYEPYMTNASSDDIPGITDAIVEYDPTYRWAATATGSVPVSTTKQGSASGTYTWASSATGKRTPKASNSSTYTWAATTAGKRTPNATATGSYTWAGATTGRRPAGGAATGSYTWAAAASATRTPKATATGSYTWVGTAVGDQPPNRGTAGGTYTWAATAATRRAPVGSATGGYTWGGNASGTAPLAGVNSGTASGTYLWSATATGARAARGQTTGTYTWAAAAAGARHQSGQAAGGGYGWDGAAIGWRVARATTGGTYTFTGTATGEQPSDILDGATAGGYGWGATTVGVRTPKAGSGGTYGWTGTAATAVTVIPPERVITIAAESRTITIAAEDRVAVIPAEDRALLVGAEQRDTIIPAENRVTPVAAETRREVVTP